MTTSQARDFVLALLTQYGVRASDRIPKMIIDAMLNVEMQAHFEFTKSQYGYWHALVVDGQDEYNLPDGVLSVDMLVIANERYYPAPFPYVEDAKRLGTGRTRVTENGATVNDVKDRWFWVLGNTIRVYPEPEESTGEYTSGACTVSGSTVTMTAVTLTTNEMKRRLVLVGSSYFIINSNSTTTFSVDGTPDSGAVTFVIYDKGLEIHGCKRPTALTAGGNDNIPGSDIDAMAIAVKAAYNVGMTLPDKGGVSLSGLVGLWKDYQRRAMQTTMNKTFAPKTITPFTMRTDLAGAK